MHHFKKHQRIMIPNSRSLLKLYLITYADMTFKKKAKIIKAKSTPVPANSQIKATQANINQVSSESNEMMEKPTQLQCKPWSRLNRGR